MTRPSVWPRIVSTTAWQSSPAVKPGPTPTTMGASVIFVPRLRLARIASTSASGASSSRHRHSGSGKTGSTPSRSSFIASAAFSARTARSPSTVVFPWTMASEKATVRRMAVGRSRSVITTSTPQRHNRMAAPLAISPAPRINASIHIPPDAGCPQRPGRKNPLPWSAPPHNRRQIRPY